MFLMHCTINVNHSSWWFEKEKAKNPKNFNQYVSSKSFKNFHLQFYCNLNFNNVWGSKKNYEFIVRILKYKIIINAFKCKICWIDFANCSSTFLILIGIKKDIWPFFMKTNTSLQLQSEPIFKKLRKKSYKIY